MSLAHGRTHARLVIWPHGAKPNVGDEDHEPPQAKDAPKEVYTYVVIGKLVTEHPITSWEGINEAVVDDSADQLAAFLEEAVRRAPLTRTGDATMTLLRLGQT